MKNIGPRKIVIFLLLFDVIICFYYTFRPYSYTNSVSCGLINEYPIGEIIDGLEIYLNITAVDDNFSAIDLLFATYSRENKNGILMLEIYDKENLIKKFMVNTNDIIDNTFLKFEFPIQKKSKNKIYDIKIYSENCTLDNAVTLWASTAESDQSSYNINKSKKEGTLIYNTDYKIFYKYTWEVIFFAAVLATIYTLVPIEKK